MKIAAITDIHGNLPALDAVLAEIELRAQVELAKIGMPQSGRQDAV